jgi:pilus assembly protein CpaC
MRGGRKRELAGLLMVAAAVGAGCTLREPRGESTVPAATPRRPKSMLPEGAKVQAERAAAQPPAHYDTGQSGTRIITNVQGALEVPAGQSLLLKLRVPAERVAIADPEVAEVILVSPQEILINGKGRRANVTRANAFTGDSTTTQVVEEARTSLIVWDKAGNSDMRALYVNKARIEQIFLEVTVADLNRSALEATGFDWQFLQGEILVTGTQSKLFDFRDSQIDTTLNSAGREVMESLKLASERVSYSIFDFDDNFVAFLEVLQRENLAKILARPTVLARSGEEAHFRVGGEVPVVYATNNVATVNFKEFGVLVSMTPTLNDDGIIDLRVSTEVSQPTDAFRAVVVSGFSVPAFLSRKADTRVRLREDETLMIAGLYREDETEDEDKTPYLGDLPYLGVLFRKTRFERTKNELVITVRPRIARSPEEVTPARLPTDRGPLTRGEVRTKPEPNKITRPRFGPNPTDETRWPPDDTTPFDPTEPAAN